jgi:hypothetical protein
VLSKAMVTCAANICRFLVLNLPALRNDNAPPVTARQKLGF